MRRNNLSVLLVEDDPDDAYLFEWFLEKTKINGIKIHQTDTLAESLEKLKAGKYDLIISDLNLPDASGMDAIEALGRESQSSPILILTGSDDDSLLDQAAHLGVYDYVHKTDLNERYLKRTIRYVLSKFEVDQRNKELDAQLEHAQKMEAVGQLAGGIAHDFNNKLAIIHGSVDSIPKKFEGGENPLRTVNTIKGVVGEAAKLTAQLLAFSRRQEVIVETIDLVPFVKSNVEILSRVLGDNVDLRFKSQSDKCYVDIDVNQLEQVVMNLTINARDALEGKDGRIEVAIEERTLDASHEWPGIDPGDFVYLSVSDSGKGMSEEVKSRIFEPFFTTKDQAKVAGLGLSVVHGILAQHKGQIKVQSQAGKGSTFEILFPKSKSLPQALQNQVVVPDDFEGATVLLAEDEPVVRRLMEEFLKEHGFVVIPTVDGKEALEKFKQHQSNVDLIISDVVMPEMTGVDFLQKVRVINHEMPFVFMSGYSKQEVAKSGQLPPFTKFLPKPCDPENLLVDIKHLISQYRQRLGRQKKAS